MQDRKEPSLDNMVPSRDDFTERASAPVRPKSQPSQPQSRPRPAAVSKSSPLVPLALLLALTGLGLAGFAYWQLLVTQQQAAKAEKRIEELEQRLALSDDESSQSVTALQANLKSAKDSLDTAHEEIRKLWDTRNVNRKGISDNEKALESLKSGLSKTGKQAAEAQTLAKAQADKLKSVSSELALQAEKLTLVNDSSDGQRKQMREALERLNQMDRNLTKLQKDLTSRVAGTEEAVKAIDAYRLTTNRELLAIKRQLGLVQ